MFQNWGFLITEIAVLLLIAALLGLFIGWLVWGRSDQHIECQRCKERDEADRREAQKQVQAQQEKPAEVIKEVSPVADIAETTDSQKPEQVSLFQSEENAGEISEDDSNQEDERPLQLTAPRGEKADDLKKIKGIGPQLEKLCNSLGFYHFDQIAEWSDKEIAWVDTNLGSFSGRVVRDDWVGQAKKLAAGEETEFSSRVDKGEVY